jgi:hypothetical protein
MPKTNVVNMRFKNIYGLIMLALMKNHTKIFEGINHHVSR